MATCAQVLPFLGVTSHVPGKETQPLQKQIQLVEHPCAHLVHGLRSDVCKLGFSVPEARSGSHLSFRHKGWGRCSHHFLLLRSSSNQSSLCCVCLLDFYIHAVQQKHHLERTGCPFDIHAFRSTCTYRYVSCYLDTRASVTSCCRALTRQPEKHPSLTGPRPGAGIKEGR